MEKDFLVPALMVAKSEINLILDELIEQFYDKITELFEQSDERWIERIQAFTFQEEIQSLPAKTAITKENLATVQEAKLFMILQGLNAKSKLKQIAETQDHNCLGQLIGKVMDNPEDEAFLQSLMQNKNSSN